MTLSKIMAAIAALLFFGTLAIPAQANFTNDGKVTYAHEGPNAAFGTAHRKPHKQKVALGASKSKQAAIRALKAKPNDAGTTVKTDELSARRVSRQRYSRRGGACDGFQRCRCGTTAARNFGISYAHNGWNLKQAREWRRFPRTAFHVGAAGVQEHHVLKVVGGSSCSNATVTDEAGTYQRNVCNMTFHSVSGGVGIMASVEPTRQRVHRTARHRNSSYQQYASLNTGFAPFDRHGMH